MASAWRSRPPDTQASQPGTKSVGSSQRGWASSLLVSTYSVLLAGHGRPSRISYQCGLTGQCLVSPRLARGTWSHTLTRSLPLPALHRYPGSLGHPSTQPGGCQPSLPGHPVMDKFALGRHNTTQHADQNYCQCCSRVPDGPYSIRMCPSRSLSYLATRWEKLDPCWRV